MYNRGNTSFYCKPVNRVGEWFGKERLVLDLRHVNTFDLKSAYHHLEINPEHQILLGFSWKFGSQVKNFNFKDIFRELQFWYFHCNFLSFKSIVPMYRQPRVIFTDANQFAGAGFTVGDNKIVHFMMTQILRLYQ